LLRDARVPRGVQRAPGSFRARERGARPRRGRGHGDGAGAHIRRSRWAARHGGGESRLSVALAHETLAPLTELPSEVTLRAGTAQAIDLPSLAGAGYVWAAEVEDEGVAEASTRFRP